MKLYTGRGDHGATDLFGGQRVDKDALRVEAYGSVDELNAHLGLCDSVCAEPPFETLRPVLRELQDELFTLGADLATPAKVDEPAGDAPAHIARIGLAQAESLEARIDRFCAELPEMRQFILPGGTELAARLHVARNVCRRAERICVALHKCESIGEPIIVYLNRLSDLLFALARYANHLAGVADVPWRR